MKKGYHILTIAIILVGLSATVLAQEVEKKEKIKVEMVAEEDGERVEFSKEYSSREEMKNDPELKAWKEKHGGGEKNVWIQKDGNKTIEIDSEDGNMMFFSTDGGDETIEVKVEALDDGTIKVIRNGEEISIEELKSEGDASFQSEDGNVKVKVLKSDGGTMEWHGDAEKHVNVEKKDGKIIVKDQDGNILHESDGDGNAFFFKTGEGEDRVVFKSGDVSEEVHDVIVETEGEDGQRIVIKKHISYSVSITDLHEDDELYNELKVEDSKPLELDDLSFYPNPNDGQFNIAFSGKAKPTRYRILDMSGREVLSKQLPEFSGTYQEEVDISNSEPGVYVLQIFQGNRALSKKIVIE